MAGPQGAWVSHAILAITPSCAGWGRLLCQALIVVRKWYRGAVSGSLVLESTVLSRSVSRPDQTTVLAPQYHLPGWQGSIPVPNRAHFPRRPPLGAKLAVLWEALRWLSYPIPQADRSYKWKCFIRSTLPMRVTVHLSSYLSFFPF